MHVAILFLIALSGVVAAQKTASVSTLISENTAVAPGEAFTVALKLEHPAEWHSYYKNSGGVELPPEITWTIPEGATAGAIQWPVPEVKDGYFGKSFIYPGSPVFLIEITPPASLSPGETFAFSADAKWQICKTSCINESASFTLDLPVAANALIDPDKADFFQAARANLPKPAPDTVKFSVTADSENQESIQLAVQGLDSEPTEFIPNEPYLKALSDGGTVETEGDTTILTLQRKMKDMLDEDIPQGNTVTGILVAGESFLVPEDSAPRPDVSETTESESASPRAFLAVLWGMFLGGLLLNLMPCVFPVIGLKIMGFVQQAGENRRSIALHGVSFAGGVFASFAILSGFLFALRKTIGWGFQLQDPWVVLVLMLLMFVLALNMFGLFEMGTSATSVGGGLQSKSGHTGSFFSGVLATVVATPCSAPFLGAAIGAVMVFPAWQFFTAFGLMAAGLALPYLILSLFPQFVEKLPRPVRGWNRSSRRCPSYSSRPPRICCGFIPIW